MRSIPVQGVEVKVECLLVTVITARLLALRQDALEDLLAVDLYLRWRVNTDANLVPLDAQHGDSHIFTNYELFSHSSSQYQHVYLPLVPGNSPPDPCYF